MYVPYQVEYNTDIYFINLETGQEKLTYNP